MNQNFTDYLLKITHASTCEEIEIIQSLWSNYGKISRFALNGSKWKTVVVKNILLDLAKTHPRGWHTNNSHNRKVKSYEVETNWYNQWNQLCDNQCKTPYFIGSFSESESQWIILEDLNVNFPLRKQAISYHEVKVCLKWLANFHASFLNKKPTGLWPIGTYWHLDTRPDEFEKITHTELKAKAAEIDKILNDCQFKTIVHGDAKLANFCFSKNGKQVAAVDFQYVGGGCGMKDVAYFLGSCLSSEESILHEKALLNYYFSELKNSLETKQANINFNDLEIEWRKLYPFVCADFTRFLLGWLPNHQKINEYNLNLLQLVLDNLS